MIVGAMLVVGEEVKLGPSEGTGETDGLLEGVKVQVEAQNGPPCSICGVLWYAQPELAKMDIASA